MNLFEASSGSVQGLLLFDQCQRDLVELGARLAARGAQVDEGNGLVVAGKVSLSSRWMARCSWPSLPINHLRCENRRTASRIGEDGLGRCGKPALADHQSTEKRSSYKCRFVVRLTSSAHCC